ncbi:MAG TPA: YceI family protein [Candidimonas sp.]|nr:YceI family protein [Candidimonas sp.]
MKKLVLAAATLAATTLANAQEVVYDVEPTHTFVHFEALHSGTSTNRGRFDTVEGSIMLDRQGHKGKVDIVVRPASVNTGVDSYNDHLRNADFLKVDAFPTATFQGSGFIFENDKLKSVSGTFTLLGKQQAVTLDALRFNCYDSPRAKTEVCGGDFETTLVRSDYGMTYGLPGIPDPIRILIQIEAVKR